VTFHRTASCEAPRMTTQCWWHNRENAGTIP